MKKPWVCQAFAHHHLFSVSRRSYRRRSVLPSVDSVCQLLPVFLKIYKCFFHGHSVNSFRSLVCLHSLIHSVQVILIQYLFPVMLKTPTDSVIDEQGQIATPLLTPYPHGEDKYGVADYLVEEYKNLIYF